MGDKQIIRCQNDDCQHWTMDGCGKSSISIRDRQCEDFTERPEHYICVTVSGGMVQRVYSSLKKEDVFVEVLDYDNAKQEDADEQLECREVKIEEKYNKIY